MSAHLNAVLFDLDGTLLLNDLDVFLPRYFERLASRVADRAPQKAFVDSLMQATAVMLRNDGRATNEEVFAEVFYPLLGIPRAELEPVFMDFYHHDFPALQKYTARRPEARPAVQAAFDLGYVVVIATNPLFPAVAIHERLAWAGVDGFPYRLVTTYENSRACKPNPLYYRQILETIDQPAGECLMVGNDGSDTVAGGLGCLTYLVDGPMTELDQTAPEPAYRGPLADLPELLRELR